MYKRYAKWQLGKWWPLILVLFLCLSLPFVTALQSGKLTETDPFRYKSYTIEVAYTLLLIAGFAATFVLPPFVFAYRDSIGGADALYQAGFSRKTLRRTRVLLGLAILAIAFTAAYFFGVFVLGIRMLAIPQVRVAEGVTYTRLPISFGYVLVAYFVILAFLAFQYLINCFFASLGNSAMVQLMLMFCGTAILTLALSAPTVYFARLAAAMGNHDPMPKGIDLSFGPLSTGIALYDFMANSIRYGSYEWGESSGARLVSLLVTTGLGCGAGIALWGVKEPSGEYAGQWKPRHWAVTMIPHVAALLIGILLCCAIGGGSGPTIFGGYSMMIFFDGAYYCLLALMRRSFRPRRIDLIAYLTVAVLMIFLCTGMSVSANDAYLY